VLRKLRSQDRDDGRSPHRGDQAAWSSLDGAGRVRHLLAVRHGEVLAERRLFRPLRRQLARQQSGACKIAAWPVQACYKPRLYGIATNLNDMGIVALAGFAVERSPPVVANTLT